MLKLYHNDMAVCAQKVRMVLEEKQVRWHGQNLNLRAGDQFKPDFLMLNVKAVVPVAVHNGSIITESNAIMEYLDEVFPQVPLMPADAVARALVRKWLILLDAGLHQQFAYLSFAIAFRHQVLAVRTTPAALEEFYASIPDYARRGAMRDMVDNGYDSPLFGLSLKSCLMLLADMEEALAAHPWLVGKQFSLADIGYAPYINRLEQLQLHRLWDKRPYLAAWFERIRQTRGYREGVANWFNADYMVLMQEQGVRAWPHVEKLLHLEQWND